jgi:hypothetical protein
MEGDNRNPPIFQGDFFQHLILPQVLSSSVAVRPLAITVMERMHLVKL